MVEYTNIDKYLTMIWSLSFVDVLNLVHCCNSIAYNVQMA